MKCAHISHPLPPVINGTPMLGKTSVIVCSAKLLHLHYAWISHCHFHTTIRSLTPENTYKRAHQRACGRSIQTAYLGAWWDKDRERYGQQQITAGHEYPRTDGPFTIPKEARLVLEGDKIFVPNEGWNARFVNLFEKVISVCSDWKPRTAHSSSCDWGACNKCRCYSTSVSMDSQCLDCNEDGLTRLAWHDQQGKTGRARTEDRSQCEWWTEEDVSNVAGRSYLSTNKRKCWSRNVCFSASNGKSLHWEWATIASISLRWSCTDVRQAQRPSRPPVGCVSYSGCEI